MAILEGDIFEFNLFIHIYIYSGSATIIRFKYIKTQCIFIKMTSFDEVVIMLHKFNSNSEHTFFYSASHFRLFTQNYILRQAPHFERAPDNLFDLTLKANESNS